MPHSRFLVQNERYSFEELVANSVLPCFTSDLVLGENRAFESRVAVPIDDKEVNATYYLVCKKESQKAFSNFFST